MTDETQDVAAEQTGEVSTEQPAAEVAAEPAAEVEAEAQPESSGTSLEGNEYEVGKLYPYPAEEVEPEPEVKAEPAPEPVVAELTADERLARLEKAFEGLVKMLDEKYAIRPE